MSTVCRSAESFVKRAFMPAWQQWEVEDSKPKPESKVETKDTIASVASKPADREEPIHSPDALQRYVQLTDSQQREWNAGLQKFAKVQNLSTDILLNFIYGKRAVALALQRIKDNATNNDILNPLGSRFSLTQMFGFENLKFDREKLQKTLESYIKYLEYCFDIDEPLRFCKFVENDCSPLEVEAVFRTLLPRSRELLLNGSNEQEFLRTADRIAFVKLVESFQSRYQQKALEEEVFTFLEGSEKIEQKYREAACTML